MGDSDSLAPLPAEPTRRAITPAPQDYRRRLALRNALWPLFWIAACTALAFLLAAKGWPPFNGGAH